MTSTDAADPANPETTDAATPTNGRTAPRTLPWWVCVAIGVAAAFVGLLPWLVTGGGLPLQNLSATGEAPFVLLPFSQYAVILIFALLVVGAAVAGLTARALRPRLGRGGALLIMLGLAAVQGAALVQTAGVVRGVLQDRAESVVYLIALTAGTIFAIGVGIAAFWLIGAAPRAGALIGLTAGAIAMGSWLSGLIAPFGTVPPDPVLAALWITPWVAPVLTGVAIAWTGLDTVGRWVAAATALVLLWVAPAVTTALFNAVGSRVLAHDLDQMADYGAQVFVAALTTPALALRPVIGAAVVAVVGLVVRAVVVRRRRVGAASR